MHAAVSTALYFTKLGLTGFGGPVVLADRIRHDWVEERKWITQAEYEEGLAIASACPGPLAYQLAVYCGYVRGGNPGGIAAAIAFAVGPFLVVSFAAYLYVQFSASKHMQAAFYGVAPVIVALILKGCFNLGKKVLAKQKPVACAIAVIACAVTVILRQELVQLFLCAGAFGAYWFRDKGSGSKDADQPASTPLIQKNFGFITAIIIVVSAICLVAVSFNSNAQHWLAAAVQKIIPESATKLFLFFFRTGILVFGSGMVIVPFLKASVVDQYHWLSDQQFIDSVAVGMISPGPVVITATFVGYVVGSTGGALAATVGIFLPPVMFTLLGTPLFRRHRHNQIVQGFVKGVSIAVVGVLAGTTYIVGESSIHDLTGLISLLLCTIILFRFKKFPEQLLILLGAILGLVLHRAAQ